MRGMMTGLLVFLWPSPVAQHCVLSQKQQQGNGCYQQQLSLLQQKILSMQHITRTMRESLLADLTEDACVVRQWRERMQKMMFMVEKGLKEAMYLATDLPAKRDHHAASPCEGEEEKHFAPPGKGKGHASSSEELC